jgi:hypothetical protein
MTGGHLRALAIVVGASLVCVPGPASAHMAAARSGPASLGFTCPFNAQKVTALTRALTGFRLVAFQTQNDGLHGICIFVDPEPTVHSLLAGDRKLSITFTKGLQTVVKQNAAWHATPGWTVTNSPAYGNGAFEARLRARSARSTNQLMLSFAAAKGGSWGITIATQTSVHLTQPQLQATLAALHAARSDW